MSITQEQETVISAIIARRRNVKPTSMNGQKIADEKIHQLLELANWAPTHGYTEPWYFSVYSGAAVQQFCADHAALYRTHTPAEKFIAGNFDKLAQMGDQASHVIAICMKRGNKPNIPVMEEVAAVSCAVQNMWLGATAMGIVCYWGTGGMTLQPAMHAYLGLGEEDQVLGLFYLGYTDEVLPEGKRVKPLSEKITWK